MKHFLTPIASVDLLRIGFDVGYYDKHDIARWADQQINDYDDPPFALIEISLVKRKGDDEITKRLRELSETDLNAPTEGRVASGFVGMLLREGRNNLVQAMWIT